MFAHKTKPQLHTQKSSSLKYLCEVHFFAQIQIQWT